MRMYYRFALLPGLLSGYVLSAQISDGGSPPSFLPANALTLSQAPAVPVYSLPPLDLKKIQEEDASIPELPRFSAPLSDTDLDLAKDGQWLDLPGGDRLWRCAIQSPKALGLLLFFDRFQLPDGGRFFAYTPDGQRRLGAYTQASCTPSGKFLIGVLPGDRAVLEYYEPATVKGQAQVHLNRVDYVYDPSGVKPLGDTPEDFGQSLGCNVNVNCAQGQNWQSEKKGVARILMTFSNGAGWCTGSLVANTSGSGEPYFLTAHHCQIIGLTPDFDTWRFDFDYESPNCANPASEPTPKSVLGCQRISYRAETDFLLLKTNPIPQNYGVYFNGWNRTTATNSLVLNSTFIHHPSGDIKKISVDNDLATIFTQTINWGNQFGISPVNSHWRVVPDVGIYQPGSSGCPLFDPNKRIVGQLHGGNTDQNNACIVLNSYFGRFDLSWSQGAAPDSRLKEWLDPNNSGALTQNGYTQPVPTTISIGGKVQTNWGTAMPNVVVKLSGGATATARTNASGIFTFPNLQPNLSYTLTPERDTNDVNGVSTFDLSLINKHVLGLDTLDTPWQILAGDANASKGLSTSDIVECRKILLGLSAGFPATTSWRFFPAGTMFPNPTNPFTGFPGGPPPEFLEFQNLKENVPNADFKGVKVGDVNNNANAGG